MTDLSSGDTRDILGQFGALVEAGVPALGAFRLAAKLQNVGSILDTILAYIPSYLANAAMGIVLLSQTDRLASSVLFQYMLPSAVLVPYSLWYGCCFCLVSHHRDDDEEFYAHVCPWSRSAVHF